MIIKTGNSDWYIPNYERSEDLEHMMLAYEAYTNKRYKTMRPEDWAKLYDVDIVWVSDEGRTVSVTHPQHPYGRDLTCWLEHIWKHSAYYIGRDAHGFEYMVICK